MSGRFFGEWPEGIRIVRFEPSKYAFKDSDADALTRVGRIEKPLSPLTDDSQIVPMRKSFDRSGSN